MTSDYAGALFYPTPAATADGDWSTTVHFSPEQPNDVDSGNWIQTVLDTGWFAILRCYSPKPSFFERAGGRARWSQPMESEEDRWLTK